MRQFIKRALQKVDKLNPEQFEGLLHLAAKEIDRLETVMDSLIRGVLVCDTEHKLILANKAARRFLSIVSYEQGRETIWSIISDEVVAEFLAKTLIAADKVEGSEFSVDINGMEKLLSISVMPVVQDQKVTGSLVLVDDITERKSREAKMRRMENLASLTTLAAGIAHEIKNPLGSLSIHVQLIQKAMAAQEKLCNEIREVTENECDPEKHFRQINKYLNVVNEEIDRLNAIVVDFLFALRPINADLRRGDVNALITELADFVSFELINADIECVLDLAENLSAVNFDAGLMKPALLNVIQNAAAAMNCGGKLSITTEEAENEIRIIIADTGTGISENNLSKIFEPYFSTKKNGTGLGLTVLFKIVKEHRGEISVKSREGEGTVFTIALPKPQVEQKLITYDAVPLNSGTLNTIPIGKRPEGTYEAEGVK
jgi:PAS domain S-box-containing protein